jgi:hypothetical protein
LVPACRPDVHTQVGFKICHVLNHFGKLHPALQASTPHTPIYGPEHHVVGASAAAHGNADQPIQVGLVRDQRLTPAAEATGLTQKDQAEVVNMNHQ